MTGYISKRNGKYLARYRHEGKEQPSKTFAKKSDARAWLDEVTRTITSGTWVDPSRSRITFQAYYEQFSNRQRWRSTTRKAMDLAVADCDFGDVPLNKITHIHIETWMATMDARHLAPGTMQTRLSNVRTVLRGAQRDRLIGIDPSIGVRAPRRPRRATGMQIPTTEQVHALVQSTNPAYRALTAAAAYAGLRMGEAAALQLGDLKAGPVLRVERQVQRAGGGRVEIRPPKYDSTRVMSIHPRLARLIEDHADRYEILRDDAFLFTTEGGHPPHQNTIGYAHRRAREAAGLPWINFHLLRHYYASGLIRDGITIPDVQHALGHESPRETLKTYSHLWNDSGERVRAASASLFYDEA